MPQREYIILTWIIVMKHEHDEQIRCISRIGNWLMIAASTGFTVYLMWAAWQLVTMRLAADIMGGG